MKIKLEMLSKQKKDVNINKMIDDIKIEDLVKMVMNERNKTSNVICEVIRATEGNIRANHSYIEVNIVNVQNVPVGGLVKIRDILWMLEEELESYIF